MFKQQLINKTDNNDKNIRIILIVILIRNSSDKINNKTNK